MTDVKQHDEAIRVAGSELTVVVRPVGRNLIIYINSPSICLGRFVLVDLLSFEPASVEIGDITLAPEPRR